MNFEEMKNEELSISYSIILNYIKSPKNDPAAAHLKIGFLHPEMASGHRRLSRYYTLGPAES